MKYSDDLRVSTPDCWLEFTMHLVGSAIAQPSKVSTHKIVIISQIKTSIAMMMIID
jgi:hypothetical protein